MTKEIKDQAFCELFESLGTWQIPKLEYIDGKTGTPETVDVEDWADYCGFDEYGNYTSPEFFKEKLTPDGLDLVPVGVRVMFSAQQIKDKEIEVAKECFPEVYNEMVNLL